MNPMYVFLFINNIRSIIFIFIDFVLLLLTN